MEKERGDFWVRGKMVQHSWDYIGEQSLTVHISNDLWNKCGFIFLWASPIILLLQKPQVSHFTHPISNVCVITFPNKNICTSLILFFDAILGEIYPLFVVMGLKCIFSIIFLK